MLLLEWTPRKYPCIPENMDAFWLPRLCLYFLTWPVNLEQLSGKPVNLDVQLTGHSSTLLAQGLLKQSPVKANNRRKKTKHPREGICVGQRPAQPQCLNLLRNIQAVQKVVPNLMIRSENIDTNEAVRMHPYFLVSMDTFLTSILTVAYIFQDQDLAYNHSWNRLMIVR